MSEENLDFPVDPQIWTCKGNHSKNSLLSTLPANPDNFASSGVDNNVDGRKDNTENTGAQQGEEINLWPLHKNGSKPNMELECEDNNEILKPLSPDASWNRRSRRAKNVVNYWYKSIGNLNQNYYNAFGKDKANMGRWTLDEHVEFLQGLKLHGKNWKLVERHVPTRTGPQIRSHAQKFFKRIQASCIDEEYLSDGVSPRKSSNETPLECVQRHKFSVKIILAGLEKKDTNDEEENYEQRLTLRLAEPIPPCDCDNFSIK